MDADTTGSRRRTAPGGLLVASLFIVAAGVLAMHGLASHRAGSTDHAGPIHSSVGAEAPMSVPALAVATEAAQHLGMPFSSDAGSSGGLCLAILPVLTLLLRAGAQCRGSAPPPPVRRGNVHAVSPGRYCALVGSLVSAAVLTGREPLC